MKFTLSWLKDHLDTSASLAEIVDALTRVGLEVELVEDPARKYDGFVIASVIEAKPHPNADRLRVCVVDAGQGQVQVVCGAPNARTGMKSVFSPVGTYIPGKKLTLTKGVIRGVELNGMLCSAAELELSDDHAGIIELPDDAPIGVAYARFVGLDDPVIDVAVTPNRPDAAGVAGIARDLAAAGLGSLKTPAPKSIPGAFDCPTQVHLDFAPADKHLCPAFALRLVRGVTNGPSPEWMQKRLRAIGLRPISALVDITNYITFDRGRPLHVFDLAKVKGDLTVRRARAGESVLALDGKSYPLDESMVGHRRRERRRIDRWRHGRRAFRLRRDNPRRSDRKRALGPDKHRSYRPQARDRDRRPLPIRARRRSRILRARLRSRDRVRPFALRRRTFADGRGGRSVAAATFGRFPLRRSQAAAWGRHSAPGGRGDPCSSRLRRRGWTVVVPSWRPDVQVTADVVEQILRIAGVDRAPMTPLPRLDEGVAKPVLTLIQKRTRLAKRTLAALSLREAVTWSFVSKTAAELFGGGAPSLALANPIAADLSDMRPSLIPGLVAAAERNARRALSDVALFEVGQVFLGPGENDQRMAAAAVRRGRAKADGDGRHWSGGGGVDVFDAKRDAMTLLSALGVSSGAVQVIPGGPAFLHPARSATLQFGQKTVIGWFGQLHPGALEAMDADGPIIAFEIILDAVPAPKARPTKTKPKLDRSDFMPVERDLAFMIDAAVRAGDVVKAAESAERSLIAKVGVFDVYQGEGVPEGSKSIAIHVTLQPRERTLTDAEIDAAMSKIVAEVSKRTGAALRS